MKCRVQQCPLFCIQMCFQCASHCANDDCIQLDGAAVLRSSVELLNGGNACLLFAFCIGVYTVIYCDYQYL